MMMSHSVLFVFLSLSVSGEDDPGNTLFPSGLPSPLHPHHHHPLPHLPPLHPAPPPPPHPMMTTKMMRWQEQLNHVRHPNVCCPSKTQCSGSSVTCVMLGTT